MSEKIFHNAINPSSKFDIDTIAHRLSYIPRFGGQINHFYSEAQHSINLLLLAKEELGIGDINILLTAFLSLSPKAYVDPDIASDKHGSFEAGLAHVKKDIARTFRLNPLSDEDAERLEKVESKLTAHEWLVLHEDGVNIEFPLEEVCFKEYNFRYVKERFLFIFNNLIQNRAVHDAKESATDTKERLL